MQYSPSARVSWIATDWSMLSSQTLGKGRWGAPMPLQGCGEGRRGLCGEKGESLVIPLLRVLTFFPTMALSMFQKKRVSTALPLAGSPFGRATRCSQWGPIYLLVPLPLGIALMPSSGSCCGPSGASLGKVRSGVSK